MKKGESQQQEAKRKKKVEELRSGVKQLRDDAKQEKLEAKIGPALSYVWTFRDFDNMDFQTYVENNDKIYTLEHEGKTDAKAYWIDQREVGFIKEEEIKDGIKLGTDNVQQCVVVMVKGNDDKGRLAALAHVDRFTNPESLSKVFNKFSYIQDISISLYGGRDQTEEQKKISESNVSAVVKVIINAGLEKKIINTELDISGEETKEIEGVPDRKAKLLRNPETSPEVIFDPNENKIIQGQYANKGYQTKEIRLTRRRLMDKDAPYEDTAKIKRDKNLEEINLQQCDEDPEIFKQQYFDEKQVKLCVAYYCEGGYDKMLDGLQKCYESVTYGEGNVILKSESLEAYCSQTFKPFMETVLYSLQRLDNKEITKEDIYNGKAREQIKQDMALQGKLQDSLKTLKEGKEEKEEETTLANTHSNTLSKANPYRNLKEQQANVLFGNPFDDHLRRSGKLVGETGNIGEAVAAVNSDSLELLDKMHKEAVITADIDLKAVDVKESAALDKVGKVEFLAEGHHIQDHAKNTKSLIDRIESGEIDKNTVIAIERKSYGANLGMPDVIMLASIIEHNEKNPKQQLQIPEAITKDSLIYNDAVLYNAAKQHGVKVVGLEGKNLEASKDSPEEYNKAREDYMAGRITKLTEKGYNVIAYAGSAHVENLKSSVESKLENSPSIENKPRQVSEELQQMAISIGEGARVHLSQSTTTESSIPVLPNEKQPNKQNSGIGGR